MERTQPKKKKERQYILFLEWTGTQNAEYITSMCGCSDHQRDKRFRSSVSLTSSSTSPSAPPAPPPSSPSGTPAQNPPEMNNTKELRSKQDAEEIGDFFLL